MTYLVTSDAYQMSLLFLSIAAYQTSVTQMSDDPTFWARGKLFGSALFSHMPCPITPKTLLRLTLFMYFMFFAAELANSHS